RQGTKEQVECSQTGRVRNNQADKVQRSRQSVVRWAGQEQSGRQGTKGADWRVVRNSRGRDRQSSIGVRDQAGSERKQTGCRYRGSWETYTKAL
ncbi:unnamed protein product, partial [Staurois parvus]